jgi:hypothetical protein
LYKTLEIRFASYIDVSSTSLEELDADEELEEFEAAAAELLFKLTLFIYLKLFLIYN